MLINPLRELYLRHSRTTPCNHWLIIDSAISKRKWPRRKVLTKRTILHYSCSLVCHRFLLFSHNPCQCSKARVKHNNNINGNNNKPTKHNNKSRMIIFPTFLVLISFFMGRALAQNVLTPKQSQRWAKAPKLSSCVNISRPILASPEAKPRWRAKKL